VFLLWVRSSANGKNLSSSKWMIFCNFFGRGPAEGSCVTPLREEAGKLEPVI
jgi:hypothetical protein